jgi:hypothetical protein
VGRLHTRYAPVRRSSPDKSGLPLDLHVLGLPLAFILSQDQTLHCISSSKIIPSSPPGIVSLSLKFNLRSAICPSVQRTPRRLSGAGCEGNCPLSQMPRPALARNATAKLNHHHKHSKLSTPFICSGRPQKTGEWGPLKRDSKNRGFIFTTKQLEIFLFLWTYHQRETKFASIVAAYL